MPAAGSAQYTAEEEQAADHLPPSGRQPDLRKHQCPDKGNQPIQVYTNCIDFDTKTHAQIDRSKNGKMAPPTVYS